MSAESYVELAFEAEASGVPLDEDAQAAAERFDQRHLDYASKARHQLIETAMSPHDLIYSRGLINEIVTLGRNRFFVPESLNITQAIKGKVWKPKRKKWTLPTSIWKDRLHNYGQQQHTAAPPLTTHPLTTHPTPLPFHTGDFFETVDAMRNLFELDWDIAVRAHELAWHIVKCQRDPSTWRDMDKNGVHDEVDEVKEALFQHHRMIYGAFDYYSALYSEQESTQGEPDVFNMTFASFMSLVEKCKMMSRQVPHGEFETIWAIVNAADKTTAKEEVSNSAKYLNRQEFLQTLVRMAVVVYVSRGTIGDVSDAVTRLMVGNLAPYLPPQATQSSNAFRKRFCYIEKTSLILEANAPSLKALYDLYADVSHNVGDSMRDNDAMSIGEWLAFLKHTGLIESGQISIPMAKQIFLWSRLRSLSKRSLDAEIQLRHLTFTDFLEALVRLSMNCALPTDDDIEETGASDAGEFLLAMRSKEPTAYKKFLKSHKPAFTDPDGSDYDEHAKQPVWRCIEHLIKLIVRTIEHSTSAKHDASAADGVVQAEEAAKFLKQRLGGASLDDAMAHSANSLGRIEFGEALESSALRVIVTAAAIRIQMSIRAKSARRRVVERQQRVEENKRKALAGKELLLGGPSE